MVYGQILNTLLSVYIYTVYCAAYKHLTSVGVNVDYLYEGGEPPVLSQDGLDGGVGG